MEKKRPVEVLVLEAEIAALKMVIDWVMDCRRQRVYDLISKLEIELNNLKQKDGGHNNV